MFIYQLTNTNRNKALFVAANKDDAEALAIEADFIRVRGRARIVDVTESYNESHAKRGFRLEEMVPGQLIQVSDRHRSKWSTYRPERVMKMEQIMSITS